MASERRQEELNLRFVICCVTFMETGIILRGPENVAAMERGQLSSDYAQFPCHFPATISNR